MVCSKIHRNLVLNVEDEESKEGFENRNELNEAVDILEEEIKRYALGSRSQKELPLYEAPAAEPDMFSDDGDEE